MLGREAPWCGPVEVALVFALPVKDVTAVRSGDVDKLARNVLDALTRAKVYEDDVLVVRLLAEKLSAGERGPGVFIQVRTYDANAG
jgi:Holliday junction resolvase RusA-like endonuclease